MHLAIVLNTSWNLYNFRRGLIDALQKAGHTVTLIAPEDEHSALLRELGYKLVTVRMDRRGIHPGRDLAYLRELYRVYQAVRPAVVLHFTVKPNIYGTVAAHLLGIRAVNTVSGLGTVFLKKGAVSRVAQQLYRLTFRWADRVLFHNPDDYQLFVERGLVSADQAKIVPGSGVDVQRFAPVNTTPTEDHPFTFLVIARLLIDKGIIEYAEAARQLRQRGVRARFRLLGARDPQHRRGIPDATVDAWIDEGLIDYLGTTDDVRPFIARADAVVLPSYREGLPRTLLEAASMEKPLVTTDTPGCRHVVTNGHNGLLCQARDAADLAETMHRLQQMTPTERQQMGQRGRALVTQRFSEEYVINLYLSYCSSAINPHSGSAINRAATINNHHHECTTPSS